MMEVVLSDAETLPVVIICALDLVRQGDLPIPPVVTLG